MGNTNKIKQILKETKLEVGELSVKTGVSDKTLYRVLNKKSGKMQLKTAKKINEAFPKYTLEWLQEEVKENENLYINENKQNVNESQTVEDIVARKVYSMINPRMEELLERMGDMENALNLLLLDKDISEEKKQTILKGKLADS